MPGNCRPHGCTHMKTGFSWDCNRIPKEDHSVNRCIFTLNSMWILNPFTKPQKKVLCEKHVGIWVYWWLAFKDKRGPRRRSCKRPLFYKSNPGRFTSLKLDHEVQTRQRSMMLSWVQLKRTSDPFWQGSSPDTLLPSTGPALTHKV